MKFLSTIHLLIVFSHSVVRCDEIHQVEALVHRQIFSTLPTSCSGITCRSTSSSTSSSAKSTSPSSITSTTSSALTSTSSSSSKISTVWSTTSASSPVSYDQYAVTTTFTQPPSCTGGLTAIEAWGTDIYNNLIYSSSGLTRYTTCFPPQFYSSVLASVASTTLGPFTALICPYTWESYDINSTYVICCPSGYNLIAPNLSDSFRPGSAAVCSSSIGGGALLDITSFDSTGGQTVVAATAGADGTYVWANAFDGITTSVPTGTLLSTTESTTVSSHTSAPPPSSSKTSSSSTKKSSSSSSSKVTSSTLGRTTTSSTSKSSSSSKVTTTNTAIPGESLLPSCGQLCFNNMLAQYSTLGCAPLDAYCLCNNVNFGYGLQDCSNAACGTAVASTVIAFGSAYCSTATATYTGSLTSTVVPGESLLPSCGQLCFNNLLAQYSTLGCSQWDSFCLCNNVNFGYGLRDCANGACGTIVASTVIAFGNAYCSTASATHTGTVAAPIMTAV